MTGAINLANESRNYFDVPRRLAAKQAHELIDADNKHFALVDRSLRLAAAEQSERLDHLLNSPGGIGQAAMDRDLEVHRVSDRLRMLQRFGVDACLGRVELENGELLYIGRLGLTDAEGQRLLYDWRSPAAAPFFGATHANPLGVATRRRYRWQQDTVVDYWDEAFTPEALAQHQGALDDQSAFIASLGAARSTQMRDVLATIATDQDLIIRADSAKPLVVDGGPGTGKTVVALHRAAYLLYADPRVDRRRGGVLVVGPHQPYLAYVADVLPSLGEDGVRTCTLAEMVPEGTDALPERDDKVAELKASAAMVEAVEAAVRFYEEPPRQSMLVATDIAEIALSAEDWATAFEAPGIAAAHNEVRGEILEELVTILLDKVDEEIDDDGNVASTDELRHALASNEELNDALNRAWPMLSPTDLIADLLSVPAYLQRCAPSLSRTEIDRLMRPFEAPWTESDLPLLDAARHRLGDPHVSEREREHANAMAAEREHIERIVDDFSAEAEGDEYGTGLVTMLRGEDFVDALIDQAGLERPEPDALAGPFAHIIVDEAQELTDAQWQMLILRCPSRSFTIVGDRAQARHGFTESWR
ncbi:MAG: RNA polymerase recycling motor ATPase HelR, partial [Candidatus Nanopelagicales bacterium]